MSEASIFFGIFTTLYRLDSIFRISWDSILELQIIGN